MAIDFNGFFNNFIPIPSETPSFSPGYVRSNVDVLFQKATRIEAVKKSKIMDYNYLETNRNFSKKAIRPEMEKLISQLGASTQLVHVVKTQLMISGIIEYLPKGFSDMIMNYQAFMDTNVNFLSVLQQDLTFKKLASGFAADLIAQYAKGNILLENLLDVSTKVSDYFVYGLPTSNNAIREVMNVLLGNFLPESMWGFMDLLQYADLMEQAFATQPEIDRFNYEFQQMLGKKAAKPIRNFSNNPSVYDTNNITLADPYGLNVQEQLTLEITNDMTTSVQNFVSTYPNIPDDVVEPLVALFVEDFTANLNEGMQFQALPQIPDTINAVQEEIFEKIGEQIKAALNLVVEYIFEDIGVVDPQGYGTPIDRLYNLHRNISERYKMYARNDTSANFIRIDGELKPYFNGIIDDVEIERVYERLEKLINGV